MMETDQDKGENATLISIRRSKHVSGSNGTPADARRNMSGELSPVITECLGC